MPAVESVNSSGLTQAEADERLAKDVANYVPVLVRGLVGDTEAVV